MWSGGQDFSSFGGPQLLVAVQNVACVHAFACCFSTYQLPRPPIFGNHVSAPGVYIYLCSTVYAHFTTRTAAVPDVFDSGRNVGALRPGRCVGFR